MICQRASGIDTIEVLIIDDGSRRQDGRGRGARTACTM